jgi:hypothetical protein
MTLYDLTQSMTIQGNIEIKIFDADDTHTDSRFFPDEYDFDTTTHDADDIEDLEVTYMYTTKSYDGTPWLTIEVKEND